MNFDKITWKEDRLEIADLTFSLGQYKSDNWDKGAECFVLWKDKGLLDQYEKYFSSNNKAHNNILEIGMWDGGSTALWYEILKPKKIIAFDHLVKTDTDYFTKWKAVKSQQDQSVVKTFWNTNQANVSELRRLLQNEFENNSIDIVFDDASHYYNPTLASFETIFPLLKPGAIFIIEDWAWLHWKEWVYKFPKEEQISKLVYQLIQCAGSNPDIISSVTVYSGFAVIERGTKPLSENFKLQDYIFLPSYPKSIKERVKNALKALTEK